VPPFFFCPYCSEVGVNVPELLTILEHAWVLLVGACGYMFREITSLKENSATNTDLNELEKNFHSSQLHIATNLVTRQELKDVLAEIARTNERMIERQDSAHERMLSEMKEFHQHLLNFYNKFSA
jgi:hypothetical protein